MCDTNPIPPLPLSLSTMLATSTTQHHLSPLAPPSQLTERFSNSLVTPPPSSPTVDKAVLDLLPYPLPDLGSAFSVDLSGQLAHTATDDLRLVGVAGPQQILMWQLCAGTHSHGQPQVGGSGRPATDLDVATACWRTPPRRTSGWWEWPTPHRAQGKPRRGV